MSAARLRTAYEGLHQATKPSFPLGLEEDVYFQGEIEIEDIILALLGHADLVLRGESQDLAAVLELESAFEKAVHHAEAARNHDAQFKQAFDDYVGSVFDYSMLFADR